MSLRDFQSWGLDTAPPVGWLASGYSPTISQSSGRFSDGCLVMVGQYGLPMGLRRMFDSQRTWFMGFPISVNVIKRSPFVGLFSGFSTPQLILQISDAGFIQVYRGTNFFGAGGTLLGTGAHPLTANTWYFVEFGAYIDDSAGTVQVLVNGVLDIDLSGVNTQAVAGGTADTILLGGPIAENSTLSVGTAYICDDQGAENNTFLGDCRVIVQVPTGDGAHADWTPLTGGDQYAMVNEIPPDGDTTYVSSNSINGMDTFTFDDIGVSGSVIAIKVCINAEKDEVGVRTIAPVIRQLGTDYTYADIYPSAMSYGKFSEMFLVRPSDSNPWQVSDLGAGGAEFGVVVTG